MSSYYRPAYHPPTQTVRDALWADDYFGRHQYGILFDGDDDVYRPEQVAIPRDKVFVSLELLREVVNKAIKKELKKALKEATDEKKPDFVSG